MKFYIFIMSLLLYLWGAIAFSNSDSLTSAIQPINLRELPSSNTVADLRVGVVITHPFAEKSNGLLSGLSYDVWTAIAAQNKFRRTYTNLGHDTSKGIELIGNSQRMTNLIFVILMTTFGAGIIAAIVSGIVSLGEPFVKRSDEGNAPVATYHSKSAYINAKLDGLNATYRPKYMEDAIALLDSKKVSAIFLLLARASSYLNVNSRPDLYISKIKFPSIYLRFIVNDQKSFLLRQINYSIVKMTENGLKLRICNQYSNEISLTNCE